MISDSFETGAFAVTLLTLADLFSEVDPLAMGELAAEVEVIHLASGETLIQAGTLSEHMYTLFSGHLHGFSPENNGELRLTRALGPGESIGEEWMLDESPCLTTIRANRDSELVKLSRTGFRQLLLAHPDIMTKVAGSLARRLRQSNEPLPPTPLKMIAVIPAGGHRSVTEFTARLCQALGSFGRVLHLGRAQFESMFGGSVAGFDAKNPAVRWLGEFERTYRFVVLEADPDLSTWSSLCIRLADRVIAAAPAGASPELNDFERAVLGGLKNQHGRTLELVLLHEESQRVYAGTAKWLSPRNPLRHHHLRISASGDISRVARILSGHAIGLALGGGGARGMAHVGVIRAIQEAQIPIDMIGGVSIGSIVAGQHAMGCDWQTILRLNERELGRGGLNSDFTLPLLSITSGRRFTRALHRFFDDVEIEDLWLNYFCVSCNLTTSQMMVHRQGPLWKWVKASNALPGILPPVLHEGSVLIDGGLLNNQPGDILKEMCGGPVIVSNVSPRVELGVDPSYTEMPSPWRLLWSRLNPRRDNIRVPSISATMMRALLVASDRKSREVRETADYYLHPPLDMFRLDDWSKVDAIMEAGYQYAKTEIRTWNLVVPPPAT